MGDGHSAQLAGLLGELQRTGQFGSHVHQTDVVAAALPQALEHLPVRVGDVLLGLGALLGLVEEGAFHVHAPQNRAVALLAEDGPGGIKDAVQNLLAEGHGGAQKAGHALAAQILLHGAHVFVAAVHAVAEVGTGRAVDVDVHKAGGDIFAGGVQLLVAVQGARGGHLHDAVARQLHVGGDEPAVGIKDLSVFDDHGKFSFPRSRARIRPKSLFLT